VLIYREAIVYFGICILILCFGLSSVNAALATQVVDIPPIIEQSYDLREINQQILEQDRVNREQELAIRGRIEDSQKLADTPLARQQNAALEKVNQTMTNYRDSLLSRERARIAADRQRVSKYHELIALNEDVVRMKGARQTLQLNSDVLEGKYKILTELKDEMTTLNEKLKGKAIQRIALLKNDLVSVQSEDTANKIQVSRLGAELSQKQQQVDLLKSELENKITESNNQAQQEKQIQQGQTNSEDRLKWAKQLIDLKQQRVEFLNTELKNKISQEKSQSVFAEQIQDLKAQLQDKENQITVMKKAIQSGQKTQAQSDTLSRQLADQQNKMDLLKQELESKNAQSDQMTLLISDYQKKLESKNNTYNQELRQVLFSKNDEAQMEKQIAYLNAQLQQKEAQVVIIKKEMYDLQESTSPKDRDAQTKDLNLSMMRQKMKDEKINEYQDKINRLQAANDTQKHEVIGLKTDLALARQKLGGMTGSDEYEKKFKEQSQEFQSLKDQLKNAYKEITRLKDRPQISQSDLQKQVMILTLKLEAADKKLRRKAHENKAEDQLIVLSKNDPVREKLKQALDKINEQGRLINVLAQKLQNAGQSVDLTR
jgi:hypothetical protein